MNVSQISLVSAICAELDRQAAESGIKAYCSARQLNVITASATQITEAMRIDDKQSESGIGLQAWLRSDDTGTSSLTMAAVMFNAGKYDNQPRDWCHPWDPADFGRCHRFLEAVPEARALLPKMAEVSPVWKALIQHWDELTALYIEEQPQKKAPKLYTRMEALIEPARKL